MSAYAALIQIAKKAGIPDGAEPFLFVAVCDDGGCYLCVSPYALAAAGVEGVDELLHALRGLLLTAMKRGTN